ncbi:Re/Si-specific NAD(P)(+) transhydrogenase subunit alpha [Devosia sp. PTR5]|uniref:NAD(P) transhydrogenase subunit alpha n=1 Tax=Devosia oryzisoli TaxID=2774138 RepID=A0A927IS16_9HYPH|nr:Re/Si-specific NAD(P)(+) transhydrogenase subunit alpha [Devosia oryzisoli]MBD8067305.1 Re/Si-specific NAD(P)(+) transhydrogenase subunit alpha [Devosia oryzisoli]
MKVAVLRERDFGESRVAATPETVGKLIALGADVAVESGAGALSRFPDDQYAAAGAAVVPSAAEALRDADILLCVRRPSVAALTGIRPGALVIGTLDPYGHEADIAALAQAGVTAVAMEFMPRITRAQVMDILSSQANLAGYQAVIEAAAVFERAMPMMMTAAGTVRPAKAFVMGAGVAGLQAIATAKRLGAVVSATDVRAAAGEQVESLGAKFIMTDALKDASGTGGYARELTPDEQAAQAELVAGHIAKQDMVITTALIPGRPAPKLVTRAMVESMAPGSVIVDLAGERGGNVELTVPDQVITHQGVSIIGYTNLAGRIPTTASQLYARNLLSFLDTLIDKKARTLAIDWEDELLKATVLTRDGAVVHPNLAAAAALVSTPTPAAPAPVPTPAATPAPKAPTRKSVSKAPAAPDGVLAAAAPPPKASRPKRAPAQPNPAVGETPPKAAAPRKRAAAKKPAAPEEGN